MAQFVSWCLQATIFAGVAFAISLFGVLQYRFAARLAPARRAAVSIFLIGIGALLSVALTERDLDETIITAGKVVLYEDYASGFAASRWLSLVLLAAAVVEIIRGWVRQRARTAPDPAWPLLFFLLLFYGGTVMIQAFVSEHPGFTHQSLYVPLVLVALYYQTPDDLSPILYAAKAVVIALTLGSLAGIWLRPDFVLFRPYSSLVPGINGRLFGLASHANTLGPVALLGVVIEVYLPYRRFALRLLNLAACLAVLVLAESRTAWAAGALIALLALIPWAQSPQAAQGPESPHGPAADAQRSFRRAVRTLLIGIGLLIGLASALAVFSASDYLLRKTELGTLNGRFQIWDVTLGGWRENLLFGYGPEIWGEARRIRFQMFHVGQAHNQVVQTLGEAGLAGLALLVAYLVALLVIAWRRFTASRGLILALLTLMLVRCVTESPMRAEGLLSWPTFLHGLLVVVACHYLRQPVASRIPARLPAPVRSAREDLPRVTFSPAEGSA